MILIEKKMLQRLLPLYLSLLGVVNQTSGNKTVRKTVRKTSHVSSHKDLFNKITKSQIIDSEEVPVQYQIVHHLYLIINKKHNNQHLNLPLQYPMYIVSFRRAMEDAIVMMQDGVEKIKFMNALLDNYLTYNTKAVTLNFKYLVIMNHLRRRNQILHYQKYNLAVKYFEEIVYETVQVPIKILEQLYNLYEFDLYKRFLFLIAQQSINKAEETAKIILRVHNDKPMEQLVNRLKFLSKTGHQPKVFYTLEELHWFFQENHKKINAKEFADAIIEHNWLLKRYTNHDYSILKMNIITILYRSFPTLIIEQYDKTAELLSSNWIEPQEHSVHILCYLRGIYYFYKGHYEEALKHFQQALGKHKTIKERAKYLFWIANSYLALGERNKAFRTYQEVSGLYIPYYSTMSSYMVKKPVFIQSINNLSIDVDEHPNDWYFHTLDLFSSADENFNHYISFVHNINVNLLLQVAKTTLIVLKKMTLLPNHGYITILGDKIREKTGLILKESYIMPDYLFKYPMKIRLIMYSLLRKESYGRYTNHLSSTQNARGVMQIRESTAKTLCQRSNIPYSSYRLTHDNEYNIHIGFKCLEELLNIFKQSMVLAIAAYNAGSPQVLKWKKVIYNTIEKNHLSNKNNKLENNLLNNFLFIELIPITETKYYVKEVLDNLIIIMQINNTLISIE